MNSASSPSGSSTTTGSGTPSRAPLRGWPSSSPERRACGRDRAKTCTIASRSSAPSSISATRRSWRSGTARRCSTRCSGERTRGERCGIPSGRSRPPTPWAARSQRFGRVRASAPVRWLERASASWRRAWPPASSAWRTGCGSPRREGSPWPGRNSVWRPRCPATMRGILGTTRWTIWKLRRRAWSFPRLPWRSLAR